MVVPRICAVWLVALILAPFSAPFSVGDVSPSLRNATTHALPVARSPLRVKRVLKAAAHAPARLRPRTPSTSVLAAFWLSSSFGNVPLVLPLRI